MRLLVDTSVFLRFVLEPERLPASFAEAIDTATHRYLSIASVWELSIKVSIGKIELPLPIEAFVASRSAQLGLTSLPISVAHALAVATLPFHHRDPFDRLLIAQAMHDDLLVLTTHDVFQQYAIRVLD